MRILIYVCFYSDLNRSFLHRDVTECVWESLHRTPPLLNKLAASSAECRQWYGESGLTPAWLQQKPSFLGVDIIMVSRVFLSVLLCDEPILTDALVAALDRAIIDLTLMIAKKTSHIYPARLRALFIVFECPLLFDVSHRHLISRVVKCLNLIIGSGIPVKAGPGVLWGIGGVTPAAASQEERGQRGGVVGLRAGMGGWGRELVREMLTRLTETQMLRIIAIFQQ